MKTLLFAIMLVAPVWGEIAWTHQHAEGQDGGLAGDYVFFKTTMDQVAGHIMSVEKVRAVYAYTNPEKEIIVVDYEYKERLHITIRKAKREDLGSLSQGKDAKTVIVREYSLELEIKRGDMARMKITQPLNIEQQNDLLNLSVLMTLERWPIKKP